MSRRPTSPAPRQGGRLRSATDDGSEQPHYQTGHDYPAASVDDASDGGWGSPVEATGAARPPTSRSRGGEERTPPPRARSTRAPAREPDPPAHDDEEEDNPDVTRAGPPLTLEVIGGKSKGRKRRFQGVRMVIGRSPECEFHIPDPSVSRRHLELVQDESGVLMRDLGSGNGTRVNGEVVSEVVLTHGDEIGLGQTTIRFVDELAAIRLAREEADRKAEEAARREEEEARRFEEEEREALEEASRAAEEAARAELEAYNRTLPGRVKTMTHVVSDVYRGSNTQTRLLIAGGLLLVVLLGFGVRALLTDSGPTPPDPRLAIAQEKLLAGELARSEGRLDDAIILFTEAERLFPGVDEEEKGKRARAERDAMAIVKDARKLAERGQREEARRALATVPELSAELTAEVKKLLGEIEVKELQEKTAAVEHAIEAGDLNGARLALGAVPEAARGPYLEQIAAAEALEAEATTQSVRQQQVVSAAAVRRRQGARTAAMSQAFVNVSRKLHGGEFARAAQECDRVIEEYASDPDIRARAIDIQRLIPQFATNFEDGQLKIRSGATAAAVRPLRRARELLERIGLPGALGSQLDAMLATTSSAVGRADLRRNDLAGAFTHFTEALRLNPNDAEAREGMVQVRSQAQRVYYEGYMVRDRDPATAKKKFRLVVQIAPSDSEIAEKARAYLADEEPLSE